ncbi:hypothetical protein D3C76_1001260 [compost metagenome]
MLWQRASNPTDASIAFGIVIISSGSIIEAFAIIALVLSDFLSLVSGFVSTEKLFPSLPVPHVVGTKTVGKASVPCFIPNIYSDMSPGFFEEKAILLAASIILPPPRAKITSHPVSFIISTPSYTVVVKGFCSTLSKISYSTFSSFNKDIALSSNPLFLVLFLPVTISAFLPYLATSIPISELLPLPNSKFTGKL